MSNNYASSGHAHTTHKSSSTTNKNTANTTLEEKINEKKIFKANVLKYDERLLSKVNVLKQSGVGKLNIDLVFILDCTASMQDYIDTAISNIKSISEELIKLYAKDRTDLRFAVICYRDIEDVKPRQIFHFNNNSQSCINFLSTIKATTNINPEYSKKNIVIKEDWPEDLTGALNDVKNLYWRNSATKIAIIIADAPCHGQQFYDLSNWIFSTGSTLNNDGVCYNGTKLNNDKVQPKDVDNHYLGDPNGLDPLQIMKNLRLLKINLHFFKIKNETDVMIEKFSKAYNRGNSDKLGSYKLEQYYLGDNHSLFLKLSMDSISKSISATSIRNISTYSKSASIGLASWSATKKQFRPSFINAFSETMPNEEISDLNDNSLAPSAPAYDIEKSDCLYENVNSIKWGNEEIVEVYTPFSNGKPVYELLVKQSLKPFSSGAMRVAYWLTNVNNKDDSNNISVVKEGKLKGSQYNSKEAHFCDLDSLKCAKELSVEWNKLQESLGNKNRINFLDATVLHFKERPIELEQSWTMCEPVLPNYHSFRKYNNNCGNIDPSIECEIPNCFSHWTWCASAGEICIVDMQGVLDDNGTFLCTDPQVQHQNIGRYGRGNLGENGIASFFAGHDCGPLCHSLNLIRPGQLKQQNILEFSNCNILIPEAIPVIPVERSNPVDQNGEIFCKSISVINEPSWIPDEEIFKCQVRTSKYCKKQNGIIFNTFNHRHHCRSCGNIACNECSSNRMRLPFQTKSSFWQKIGLENKNQSRVCDNCINRFVGTN